MGNSKRTTASAKIAMSQENISIENHNGAGIKNAAIVFFPEKFDETSHYAGIVVGHPAGGVKEQTASIYAKKLAEAGFVAIAFDASYNGGSTGEPRHLENPYVRVEDNSAVVDYLTTLPYIDNNRIGIFGICTSGGYSINAAIDDRRIKAAGAVSAVNVGQMFREGWEGGRTGIAKHLLEEGAEARTAEAVHDPILIMDWSPETRNSSDTPEQQDAYEYYRTMRGAHPESTSKFTGRSLTQLATYDAFDKAELFLTQPVLLVVGSEAGTKWYSDELLHKVEKTNKTVNLHIVEGASHFDLYDKDLYVDQAISVLVPFYEKHLK